MPFQRTFDAAQIWLGMVKNVLGILRPATASRCEISHYRLALICCDDAPCLADRSSPHRRFDRNAFVHLRVNRRHHVEALVAVSVLIRDRVRSCCDGLRLLSFQLRQA